MLSVEKKPPNGFECHNSISILGCLPKSKTLKPKPRGRKNPKAESLRGMNKQLNVKPDICYFVDRIWVPLLGNLCELVMDEAHKSRYFVHSGSDNMYHELKLLLLVTEREGWHT